MEPGKGRKMRRDAKIVRKFPPGALFQGPLTRSAGIAERLEVSLEISG